MHMLNRGSLIIELIIYLALVAFLGVSAFTWFARSQRQLLHGGHASNVLMQLYSATDLLIRDLRMSPRARDAWLVRGPSSVIWRGVQGDVGWYAQKNGLYRIEGKYNPQTAKWTQGRRSLALQGITRVEIHPVEAKNEIDHVEVTLVTLTDGLRHTAHECVYPRRENA